MSQVNVPERLIRTVKCNHDKVAHVRGPSVKNYNNHLLRMLRE
jgi:hypothetical protein